MIWKDRKLHTVGEWVDALGGIRTVEDAAAFLLAAHLDGARAESVAYLTTFLPWGAGLQLRQWMGVRHPIYGDATEEPAMVGTLREGFERGRELCKE